MRVALVLMLFLLSLFGGRLVQVQGLDASALATQALRSRTQTQTIFAHRGDIVDSTGDPLATTVELRDVLVDQTLVGQYKRRVGEDRVAVGLNGAAEDLAPLLDVPVATLAKRLTGTNRGATVAKTSPPTWPGRSCAWPSRGSPPARRASACTPRARSRRTSSASSAARAAGGAASKARTRRFCRTPGKLTYESSEEGLKIPTGVLAEVDPRDGCTVHTTIDRDLQYKAQQLLEAQVKETKAKAGYAVVLDTAFDVRALAVEPTFDPNHYGQAPGTSSTTAACSDTFEPGSTAKVITLAAALQEGGRRRPEDRRAADPAQGRRDLPRRRGPRHRAPDPGGVHRQVQQHRHDPHRIRMSPQTLYGYSARVRSR